MADPKKGLYLFVYTSLLMFCLRFIAGPIVEKISPLGLLCASGVLGFVGLNLLGAATTGVMCVIAATVYAAGKTFLWPTMLAVASERFPKGGAIAIGMMGAVGMISAGAFGGPWIGFKQDYFASQKLEKEAKPVFERYKAGNENAILFGAFKTTGLDGSKVGVLEDGGKELGRAGEILKKDNKTDANHQALATWWDASKATAAEDKKLVTDASLHGGRSALKITSFVPAVMAVLYFLLILFFKARGGYKALKVDGSHS